MNQTSALESNIDKLREYAETKKDLTPALKTEITKLITQYGNIKQLGEQDANRNINMYKLEKTVSEFMTKNNIGPVSLDGGRRRKSASSSSRSRGSRSSKKRSTQRKQKRRQRRGSRRAY